MPQEQSNNNKFVYVRFYKLNILKISTTFYKLESMRDVQSIIICHVKTKFSKAFSYPRTLEESLKRRCNQGSRKE